MVPVLVSTAGLESLIFDVLTEQVGQHFPTDITNMISRLCDSYNDTQTDELIDAALKGLSDKVEDYSLVDLIVDMFVRLLEGYVNANTEIAVVKYESSKGVIVISSRPIPKKTIISTLIEEFRHAESQGDYLPERVRRAFEGLL